MAVKIPLNAPFELLTHTASQLLLRIKQNSVLITLYPNPDIQTYSNKITRIEKPATAPITMMMRPMASLTDG